MKYSICIFKIISRLPIISNTMPTYHITPLAWILCSASFTENSKFDFWNFLELRKTFSICGYWICRHRAYGHRGPNCINNPKRCCNGLSKKVQQNLKYKWRIMTCTVSEFSLITGEVSGQHLSVCACLEILMGTSTKSSAFLSSRELVLYLCHHCLFIMNK
jgi:hypothetical protein